MWLSECRVCSVFDVSCLTLRFAGVVLRVEEKMACKCSACPMLRTSRRHPIEARLLRTAARTPLFHVTPHVRTRCTRHVTVTRTVTILRSLYLCTNVAMVSDSNRRKPFCKSGCCGVCSCALTVGTKVKRKSSQNTVQRVTNKGLDLRVLT